MPKRITIGKNTIATVLLIIISKKLENENFLLVLLIGTKSINNCSLLFPVSDIEKIHE
jgi:hypothetical protein